MLAAARMLTLKAFSFACQLHHFLEERDELRLDLLCLVVGHFAVKQRIGNELLYVRNRRRDVRALSYRLALLAAIYRSLDLLCGHLSQCLRARHEHLYKTLYESVYHLNTSFQMLVLFDSPNKAAVS